MVFNVHRNHKLIREGGKGVWRWGKRAIHCHHKNDSCIKMGSDESHFNVSLIVSDKVTRRCLQTTAFWKRKKRNRAEALLLTARPNRLTCANQHLRAPLGSINCAVVLLGDSCLKRNSYFACCVGRLSL